MTDELTFAKRKIAGTFASYLLGFISLIFGTWILCSASISLIFIIPGIVFPVLGFCILFGKEVCEINFQTAKIQFYFRVLFFIFRKKEHAIPEISYLMIRDLNAKSGSFSRGTYTITPYYEISFVNPDFKKTILCISTSYSECKEVITLILQRKAMEFRDNTLEKSF